MVPECDKPKQLPRLHLLHVSQALTQPWLLQPSWERPQNPLVNMQAWLILSHATFLPWSTQGSSMIFVSVKATLLWILPGNPGQLDCHPQAPHA